MYTESELTWAQAKQVANQVIYNDTGQHLSDVEMMVFHESWQGQTYEAMGESSCYTTDYLNKDVGNKLWRKLTDALGERVTKRNLRGPLERAFARNQSAPFLPDQENIFLYPEGSLPKDSSFYIEREGIESLCYQAIDKPGALIRIKAPKHMGKTSLMNRIFSQQKPQKLRAVCLDFGSIERSILTDLERLLRWLCSMVSKQLKIENRINDFWDNEILGSNDNCTIYFEEYVLPTIDCPLILGMDTLDRIFPYTEVVEDFLAIVRSWHEKGKIYPLWKQLRLVIAHSTECYVPLNMNQSPFNAGIPVELREFNQQQVNRLAHRHGLNWQESQINALMDMVGGHPYLVRLALYQICVGKLTLEQVLQEAPTEAGIFSDYLRQHLEAIQGEKELLEGFQKIISANEPVELDSLQIYKLHSMGLVHLQDNRVSPCCNLYYKYFRRVLLN